MQRYSITYDNIRETKAYLESNPIRQKLVLKLNSFKEINHAFNVAKEIGIKAWEKQTAFQLTRINIIKELIKKHEK